MSLLIQAKNCARREREATVSLLDVLVRLEETKEHLRAGYTSLFHFLTTGLLYSESSAAKRVRAVRAIQQFPEIRAKLLSRELSLSSLSLVASLLTEENFSEILVEVGGKSRREVESIVARRKAPEVAQVVVRERIQPVVVAKKVQTEKEIDCDLFSIKQSDEIYCPRESREAAVESSESVKLKLTFSVEERVGAMIEEAKVLLSNRYPVGATMEELFEAGLAAIISEEKRKRASRGTRKAKAPRGFTRHIPAKVKAKVLERDRHCCSWKGEGGKSCGSKWGLELDHITPISRGGQHTPDNLRVLCRAHHKMVTEDQFG